MEHIVLALHLHQHRKQTTLPVIVHYNEGCSSV